MDKTSQSLNSFISPAAVENYQQVKVDAGNKQGKIVVNKKATDKGITITVNDLAFVMHYRVDGLTENKVLSTFELEDRYGDKLQIDPRTVINDVDYETGQGTYELKTDRPQEIAKIIVHGYEYTLMNDYKFDIEVQ